MKALTLLSDGDISEDIIQTTPDVALQPATDPGTPSPDKEEEEEQTPEEEEEEEEENEESVDERAVTSVVDNEKLEELQDQVTSFLNFYKIPLVK